MRLIQRGKRLFKIHPPGRIGRCFRASAVAGVLVAGLAETESRATVIVHDRQSTAIASASAGFGSGPPTLDTGFDPKFTNPNAPDFSPFGDGASANASVAFQSGDKFFSFNSSASASHNSQLTFNAITHQLFGATANTLVTANASGNAGPGENGGASASGQGDFNLIFRVTDSSAAYTLSGSIQGNHISDSNTISLVRVVDLAPGEFSRFPPGLATIDRFDLQGNGPGLFAFSGQLSVGMYQLLAKIEGRAGTVGPGASNSGYDLKLEFTPVVAPATEIRWTGPSGQPAGTPPSGTFATATNWTPAQVPEKSTTRNDIAVFDLNNNYAVNINGNRTVERLVVRAGRVDFNNNILTVAATSPTVPSVSIENDGRLNIATGGLRSEHAIIGNAPPVDPANPPTAEVLVANINQGWQLTGNLAVGGAGKGRLFLANGGLVGSASATIGGPFGGEAIVGGHDSRWATGNLAVGSGGNGSLNIEAGAEVESGVTNVIGFTAGSVGEVTVTGVDATGSSSSNWTIDDVLTVGGAGATGGLNILDGGAVFAFALGVAGDVGSIGRVVVSGRNASGIGFESRLVAQAINIGGNGGQAEMFVTDGGIVSSNLFMNIEQGGTLEITGPTSLVDVTVDVNVGTNISGLISLNGGNMIVGGLLHVGAGGSIEGNGTLIAPNRQVEIGGNIDMGLSPGKLTFDADVALTATGRVRVEMAGTAPGLFDVLEITGDATLDGTLLLEFIDGFAPRAGDEFKFLDVDGALSGSFANIEVRNLAPGFQFDLRPGAGGLTMVALNDGVFVPEPATVTMLFAGMLVLITIRRAAVS